MNILHISPIDMTIANGLRFSVPGLTIAQNNLQGVSAALLNIDSCDKLDESEVSNFKFTFFRCCNDIEKLEEPFNRPDIVVFHGVYFLRYIQVYKKLIRLDIPYVIVPRVSLTKGAQRQNRLKKKLGNTLLFGKFIAHATKIHYLTENEKKLSEAFKKESFIVGNGIGLPEIEQKEISENVNLAFIGRYDINHKGLDVLIKSINNIKEKLISKGVKLRLYGSDFRNGKAYIQKQIDIYDLDDVLKVNDAVYGEKKHTVLLETDIFISPSRFEGHPMAVIEAMAYGIPCILTKGTNMLDNLVHYNAGWSTELNIDDISKKILLAVDDKKEVLRKGMNARKLVEENYTWDRVASQTIEHYSEIINKRRI